MTGERRVRRVAAPAPIAPTLPPDEVVLQADTVLVLGVTCRRSTMQRAYWCGSPAPSVRVDLSYVRGVAGLGCWTIEVHIDGSRVVCAQAAPFAKAHKVASSQFDAVRRGVEAMPCR